MVPSKHTGPLHNVKRTVHVSSGEVPHSKMEKKLSPHHNKSKLFVRAKEGPAKYQNKPSTSSGKINHTAGIIDIKRHLTCIFFVISLLYQKKEKFLL
jgi:hypothetical protein